MTKLYLRAFLCTGSFLLWVHTLAQQVTLNSDYDDVSVALILNDLKTTSSINFSYAASELEQYHTSIGAGQYPLDSLLNRLLSPIGYQWEVVSADFILIKRLEWLDITLKLMGASQDVLPFATVGLLGTSRGYVADAEGIVNFRIPNDSSRVVISCLGYAPDTLLLVSNVKADIQLQPSATYLDEVVVREFINQGILIQEQAQKLRLNVQDIQVLPGLSESDVLLSAQAIPGIGSTNESASGINIRGGSVDQTSFLWNDIPLYNPAHYFGHVSSFIPSAIGNMEVYRNHVPVEHTGFAGGLLALQSRVMERDRPFQLETNVNLTHFDIYSHFKPSFLPGQLMVAARRSFNDLLLTPTYRSISEKVFEGSTTDLFQTNVLESEFDFNSQILFSDINTVWSAPISARDSVRVSYLYANGLLDFDSEDDQQLNLTRQENETRQHAAGVKWFRQWNDRFSNQLNVAHSHYSLDYSLDNIRNFPGDIDAFELRSNDIQNQEIKLNSELKVSKHQSLTFGYQLNHLKAGFEAASREVFDDGPDDVFSSSNRTSGTVQALYGNYQFTMPKWQLAAGVRQGFYSFESSTLDPQVRISYKLVPALTLKGAWGRNHQYLQSFQEDNFTLSNSIEQLWILAGADEGRRLIRSTQGALGFLFAQKGWVLDVEGYRKSLGRLNARKINRTVDPFFLASETIIGVDVLLKKRFKRLRSWVSYSYQQSEAEIEGIGLNDLPSAQNIPHQLNVVASYEWHALSVSVGYVYKTGLPYAFSERLMAQTTAEGITFFEVDYARINQNRLPDYHRFDASVWYHLNESSQGRLAVEVGFSILNLGNHRNFADRTYRVGENEEEAPILIQQDQFLYGFTPNLSVKVKFF